MKDICFPKVISFDNPLEEAYLIKREKRFLIEFTWGELTQTNLVLNSLLKNQSMQTNLVQNSLVAEQTTENQLTQNNFAQNNFAQNPSSQESFWAHTNNTGSMMGLIHKGRRILLSKANNPKRKLAWTLEAICTQPELLDSNLDSNLLPQGKSPLKKSPWLGVNTSLPNKFLQALFFMKDENNKPLLPWTEGYNHIRMEATNGESRLDACITSDKDERKPSLWVECKNVSLVEDCTAAFPDAVSVRALKHLDTLIRIVQEGQRAAMLYVVQRTDGKCFSPADYIDINYSQKFIEAYHAGVEIYVIVANVQKDGVYFGGSLPVAPCTLGMLLN